MTDHYHEDTIAAISTPIGEGGIGIIRLSGPCAISVADSIFVSSTQRELAASPRGIYHGEIVYEDTALDEVLISLMHAPRTYTCEDVVEVNCHGGIAPLNAVLEAILKSGVRLAEPGEFTKRAFLNGRIDLIQAEAVIDRIRAKTRAGMQAAEAAATGVLSKTLHSLTAVLQHALAHIEAAVDFPEEDLPILVNEELRQSLIDARAEMRELLGTAEAGRLYREGVSIAIVGRPNAGKSSLFNALLRDARAIVTPHAGTTRDIIEETITIEGIPVRISDTAGLRSTDDEIERIGISAARKALQQSALVILVMDSSRPESAENEELVKELTDFEIPVIPVMNKADLQTDVPTPDWVVDMDYLCKVSATEGTGLKDLEKAIGALILGESPPNPDNGMLTRLHQRDSLRRAEQGLEKLLSGFSQSPEFLSIDLRDAINALGEITGETTPDDILDRIFASFCIGK